MAAPLPANEAGRLQALQHYAILDTPPEAVFDRMTVMAARLFGVPVVLVTLIDKERQWMKSCYGVDIRETSRDIAFCSYTILSDATLVVPDLRQDERFKNNPLVSSEPHVRFYAGAPLKSPDGFNLGSLCLIDFQPRELTAAETETLSDLAAFVVDELELRRAAFDLNEREGQLHREISEHKTTNAALSESEKLFKATFELSPIGMAMVAPDGRWLKVNRRLCEMVGYAESELLALTFQDITHPDDLALDLSYLRQMLKGERLSYEMEKRYIRKDGSLVWILLNVALVRDAAGEPLHFISQVQEISARKQAEAELKQAAQRIKNILESITDAFFSLDREWRFTYLNQQAEYLLNCTQEEVLGCNIWQRFPNIVGSTFQSHYLKVAETGIPATFEDFYQPLDKWFEVHAYPSEEGLSVYFADIGERKRTELALRESEARYGRIASNLPGMVFQFITHPDGSLEMPYISEGCREIYGIEPRELQKNVSLVIEGIHPEDRASFRSSIRESEAKLRHWQWEGRIVAAGGSEKWIQGISRPTREASGDILWDGLLLDITARKQGEAALQQAKLDAESAREEAERANRAKSEFLSRMSHELRTPLNAILGFAQLLELSELEVEDGESVEQILRAGRHLLGLINEVLDIARIESGHLTVTPEPVNVSEMFADTLDLVRPLAAQRGIQLQDGADLAGDYYVLADPQRIRQVLLNLLSNAIKYNRQGGAVRLSCAPMGAGRVRLSVEDSGLGIAPEDMDRLFTPFDRLGAERHGIEGTGIGLALSRRLVEVMDGEMGAESEVGQGSTFWIELPAVNTAPVVSWPEGLSVPSGRGRKVSTRRVVLYIEGNLSSLETVQRLLAPHPEIKLLYAMRGELGLELARRHHPNLILLDLRLSEMTGYEVLQALRRDDATQHIPVVIVDSEGAAEHIQHCMAEGAQAYLTKPFEIHEFMRVLEENLAEKQMSAPSVMG